MARVHEVTKALTVKSTRDLGPQFGDNPHHMIGQDGAYSIPLAPGKALWYFGDTLIGSRVPRESLWFPGGQPLGPGDMSGHGSIDKLYTNTGLILHQASGGDGLHHYEYILDANGDLKQLVPRDSSESPEIRIWCFHGHATNSQLYLYYQVVRMLADGPMPVNFEILGSGLAQGNTYDWNFTRVPADDKLLWWPADQPQFGCVALPGTGDWLYVYGVLKNADGQQECNLARVREDRIADHSKYEYLVNNSPQWSSDVRRAHPIMSNMPNEMSVSWNSYLGCYLAVHSYDLTGRIVARTSQQPWGPWSEAIDLWQVPAPVFDYHVPYSPLIYAGKEHPELSGDDGRTIYVTYVEFEEYLPHLIQVTFA
jgi:hypothetical protein